MDGEGLREPSVVGFAQDVREMALGNDESSRGVAICLLAYALSIAWEALAEKNGEPELLEAARVLDELIQRDSV